MKTIIKDDTILLGDDCYTCEKVEGMEYDYNCKIDLDRLKQIIKDRFEEK